MLDMKKHPVGSEIEIVDAGKYTGSTAKVTGHGSSGSNPMLEVQVHGGYKKFLTDERHIKKVQR